jgi:hypothetical protein
MRKILFVLVAGLFLSACTKRVVVYSPDAERQRTEERQRQAAETLSRTQMTGCAGVVVMEDVSLGIFRPNPDVVEVSTNATRSSRINVMVVVRVFNTTRWPIDVETPFKHYGPVVRNLCPGGAVTLSFPLSWEDSNSMQLPLKAIARISPITMATSERTFYLNRSNASFQRIMNEIWQVQVYGY